MGKRSDSGGCKEAVNGSAEIALALGCTTALWKAKLQYFFKMAFPLLLFQSNSHIILDIGIKNYPYFYSLT